MPPTFYTHEATPESYEFEVSVKVIAGMPITDIYSATHLFDWKSNKISEVASNFFFQVGTHLSGKEKSRLSFLPRVPRTWR